MTYTYRCDACGSSREVRHSMMEKPPVACAACGAAMRKDVGASFPHVSLRWHNGQGIGDRLVIQSARRQG